jgi:hypothetical protein
MEGSIAAKWHRKSQDLSDVEKYTYNSVSTDEENPTESSADPLAEPFLNKEQPLKSSSEKSMMRFPLGSLCILTLSIILYFQGRATAASDLACTKRMSAYSMCFKIKERKKKKKQIKRGGGKAWEFANRF